MRANVPRWIRPKLDACIVKQDESAVRASMKQGDSLGVNGTPTLFINGERISGALPQPELWIAIDRALREAGVQPPPQVAEDGKKANTAGPQIETMRSRGERPLERLLVRALYHATPLWPLPVPR